jgi:hypothetical protein
VTASKDKTIRVWKLPSVWRDKKMLEKEEAE